MVSSYKQGHLGHFLQVPKKFKKSLPSDFLNLFLTYF